MKTTITIVLIVALSALSVGCRSSQPRRVSLYETPEWEYLYWMHQVDYVSYRRPNSYTVSRDMQRPIGRTVTPRSSYVTQEPHRQVDWVEPHGPENYTTWESERQVDLVGPRGPEGPVGPRGRQGPTGLTGYAGYALSGPRGAEGPSGAMGAQGFTGAQGPAGDLMVGPVGSVGPTGLQGSQGPIGQTGARGASAGGYAGPTGPVGPAGNRGPMGETGRKGPALVGPAGPAGRSGPGGEQGARGWTGTQGSTTAGVAGDVGPVGFRGDQGLIGPTGPQGPIGVLTYWASYRDFLFDPGQVVINDADWTQVVEVAAYMKANPSLQLGIDGSTNPRATQRSDIDLCDNRVKAVCDALIAAGVPSTQISEGLFGDVRLRRSGRVEVLIKSR